MSSLTDALTARAIALETEKELRAQLDKAIAENPAIAELQAKLKRAKEVSTEFDKDARRIAQALAERGELDQQGITVATVSETTLNPSLIDWVLEMGLTQYLTLNESRFIKDYTNRQLPIMPPDEMVTHTQKLQIRISDDRVNLSLGIDPLKAQRQASQDRAREQFNKLYTDFIAMKAHIISFETTGLEDPHIIKVAVLTRLGKYSDLILPSGMWGDTPRIEAGARA